MKKSTEQIDNLHRSVLLTEVIQFLDIKEDGLYVDATLGLGGHANEILSAGNRIRLIGIDQDLDAISHARKRMDRFGSRVEIFHRSFSEISAVLKQSKIDSVDGIIADLGVSSIQFDSPGRGFSFRFDAPLDMRMNADSDDETAAELLKRLSQEEIANLIYQYGEEKFSRRIARRIVEKRDQNEPVETTADLTRLVEKAVKRKRTDKIHPATKTFQALRIAVNRELEILEGFIRDSVDLLKPGGRLAVITFHSLEDRIVKRTLQNLSGKCFCPPKFPQCVCGAIKTVEILTRKPIVPGKPEQETNPRSRSAKLRVCTKLN